MSTSDNTTKVPFPSKWDKNHDGAVELYKKCAPYVTKVEDYYEIIKISNVFIIFTIVIVIYITFINLWLLMYRRNYIFKRQCVMYYICLLFGSLVIIIDACLMEAYYEHFPCYIHHLLTGIGYPTYLSAVAFIIIKYYKFYYKSQIAYLSSLFSYSDNDQNGILNKKFLFRYFYTSITSHKALKSLTIFNICSIIYSILMYFVDVRVAANGFCGTRLSYLPQICEYLFILIVFLPLALIEAIKFDDKFKMKKKIIILILLHIIFFVGFFLEALVTILNCSIIVQYAPASFYVFLSCVTCTSLLSLSMLTDIIHINKCNKNLKVTFNGMIELLNDKVLFREFGEYCRNDNCVENVLFYQEYWKYKNLFSKNGNLRKGERTTSENSVNSSHEFVKKNSVSESNDVGTNSIVSLTEYRIKFTSILSIRSDAKPYNKIIENEAEILFNDYIKSNSIYEINIDSTTINQINKKLRELKESTTLSEDKKIEEYSIIFDKAYKEVINNIYYNSYSNYVHQKNKEQKGKQ